MKPYVSVLLLSLGTGLCNRPSGAPPSTAAEQPREQHEATLMIVRNKEENIVARVHVENGVLEGPCEWYDSRGRLVAQGRFKNGHPHDGTFLEWHQFYSHETASPYDAKRYVQDWVTLFESTFMSQLPDYSGITTTYREGRLVE